MLGGSSAVQSRKTNLAGIIDAFICHALVLRLTKPARTGESSPRSFPTKFVFLRPMLLVDSTPGVSSSYPRQNPFRTALTLGSAAVLLTAIAVVFWYQDGRYSLPTPKPSTLVAAAIGKTIVLPTGIDLAASDTRPLFLHFFNPDCPCTRFNAEHVRSLRLQFADKVHFVAIVQTLDDQDAAQRRESLAAAARLLGPEMEACIDTDGKIAAACGVYSTPQAVILTRGPDRTLLFRGNYNVSRYCADPRTEFARQALTAIVNHQPIAPQSRDAMVAYGCELPANLAAAAKHAQTQIR